MGKSTAAVKRDPAKWKRVVAAVKRSAKGGKSGEWSARKAQRATALYKQQGGGYAGPKRKSNALRSWTKQKWKYSAETEAQKTRSKRGRYLPTAAWNKLSKRDKQATNTTKRNATKRGRQRAQYMPSVAKAVKRATAKKTVPRRGGAKMPSRSAKNYRPTKQGAGMTRAGVKAYRKMNPGSKLKTAVTGKVKRGSVDDKRRKSFCARSAGQMRRFPKSAKNPNSRIRQARRRWRC